MSGAGGFDVRLLVFPSNEGQTFVQERVRHALESVLAKLPADRVSDVEFVRGHIEVWSSELADKLAEIQGHGLEPTEVLKELRLAFTEGRESPTARPDMFRPTPMPPGLTNEHLAEAMNHTMALIASINHDMRDGVGRPLAQFIQANNFSGIVSNMLTDSLDRFSPYKHNHDQRYPDLKNGKGVGLEMKAANKAGKGGESHNAHGGWHMIACFQLDPTSGDIRFAQIEVAQLISYLDEPDGDWKYCGSKRSEAGSQRTETYYTTNRGTWKLRDGSAYLDTEIVNIRRWRRTGAEIPRHSPCYIPQPKKRDSK